MDLLMHKWTPIILVIALIFQLSNMITANATIVSKVQEMAYDPNIKCGECPCVNPCIQQQPPPPPSPPLPPPPPPPVEYCDPPPPPPPPPPVQYCNPPPPPPRFVYMAPPPPRFIYVSGSRDHPFDLRIYTNAAYDYSLGNSGVFVVLGWLAIQLVVFW